MLLCTTCPELQDAIDQINQAATLYPEPDECDVQARLSLPAGTPSTWRRRHSSVEIEADNVPHALAALGRALIAAPGESGRLSPRIERMEAMIDLSRNAVYTMPVLKRLLCQLALMGYTGLMLYMEDTYELPGHPYWGYRRGRISTAELHELDEFAERLGLELIACIQTLAHLRTALRWRWLDPIRDTTDNLLTGESGTEELVDEMLAHFAKHLRSRRIHVGMDEAVSLGMGRYRLFKGYKDFRELTMEHLNLVCRLCEKHGLEPMIWDDMLFRDHTPLMNYYGDSEPVTEEQRAQYPSTLHFVYWDYEHDEKADYVRQIRRRGCLPTILASGVWKWGGWAPHLTKSFGICEAALSACRETGISEVIVTLWGDDGAEAPIGSVLPGIALFGMNRFGPAAWQETDAFCRLLADCPLDAFLSMEKLDLIPGNPPEDHDALIPHKLLLYGDIAAEMFVPYLPGNETDWQAHYAALTEQLNRYNSACPQTRRMIRLYGALAHALDLRCQASISLHEVWAHRDREGIQTAQKLLLAFSRAVYTFHDCAVSLWSAECKGQGLEVIDLRLGGVQGRCESLVRRLGLYLSGELDTLCELDEPSLPYRGQKMASDGHTPGREDYGAIVTANTLHHILDI